MVRGSDVTSTIQRVTAALPGGEHRAGQVEMAEAVAAAIGSERHLLVQAGTGTGKSLAYLLPAVLSGRRVVVATATKALQDQLAGRDLPFLVSHLEGREVRYAVLKGRSNYLCRQRAAEIGGDAASPAGDPGPAPAALPGLRSEPELGPFGRELRDLLEWAAGTETGDRADLAFEPHPKVWAALSVGSRECPGAFRCPSGGTCFAERARARAAEADVVVVNTHLYAAHLASGGTVLPEHDVVVFDEAHEVEDVMTSGLGAELGGGRLRALAAAARGCVRPADSPVLDALVEGADRLDELLRRLSGRRVLTAGGGASWPGRRSPRETSSSGGPGDPEPQGLQMVGPEAAILTRSVAGDTETELADLVLLLGGRVRSAAEALRSGGSAADSLLGPQDGGTGGPDDASRRARALIAAGHLADDLDRLSAVSDEQVAWVEAGGSGHPCTLRLAPVVVGPLLADRLWPHVTAVLTSATLTPQLGTRLGLPSDRSDRLDVGSPFPYRDHAILYVPRGLPDRRSPQAEDAIHEEMRHLVEAAGGRTLALFTSWRAMDRAVEALRPRLAFPVLAQNDLPKPRLLAAFAEDEAACLFATLSFWQGVDVPGRTLSLVVVDRLPFPRPDDPLLQARRDRAGPRAFELVDLPRAATRLAQGAGRLIRTSNDRGVVAVLDPRLATARYRSTLLEVVPPMRRSVDRTEVESFLRQVTGAVS